MSEPPAVRPVRPTSPPHEHLREVGHLAVWTVTSAKPGNGVDMLRDGRVDTFWQSDAQQPHLINIQFQRKMQLTELHIYVDIKLDESYTPSKISIRTGTGYHDLQEIRLIELDKPCGWTHVPLVPDGSPLSILKTFFIQVAVLTNHQSGRDSHLRLIQIYGPREDPLRSLGLPLSVHAPEFLSAALLR